jgi:hypothetical protein
MKQIIMKLIKILLLKWEKMIAVERYNQVLLFQIAIVRPGGFGKMGPI